MDYFLYLVVVDLTAILEDWLGASVTLFLCNFHSLFLMFCIHASNSRFFFFLENRRKNQGAIFLGFQTHAFLSCIAVRIGNLRVLQGDFSSVSL